MLLIHRTRVPRRHAAQGQGRPRRDARRDRRARDLRRDRHPREPRRPGRRLALPHAQQAAEDRALLGRRGDGCRDPRVRVRAQQGDRRAGVGDAEEGARAAQLPGRRRDPRDTSPRLVDEGVLRTFPIIALRHAQGARPRGVEGEGCRAPARTARAQAGELDRRARCSPSASRKIISSPGGALREDRRAAVGGARAQDRQDRR